MAKNEVDLRIQQSEKYEGDEWWSWAVWIDGAPEQLRDIEFVDTPCTPAFPTRCGSSRRETTTSSCPQAAGVSFRYTRGS